MSDQQQLYTGDVIRKGKAYCDASQYLNGTTAGSTMLDSTTSDNWAGMTAMGGIPQTNVQFPKLSSTSDPPFKGQIAPWLVQSNVTHLPLQTYRQDDDDVLGGGLGYLGTHSTQSSDVNAFTGLYSQGTCNDGVPLGSNVYTNPMNLSVIRPVYGCGSASVSYHPRSESDDGRMTIDTPLSPRTTDGATQGLSPIMIAICALWMVISPSVIPSDRVLACLELGLNAPKEKLYQWFKVFARLGESNAKRKSSPNEKTSAAVDQICEALSLLWLIGNPKQKPNGLITASLEHAFGLPDGLLDRCLRRTTSEDSGYQSLNSSSDDGVSASVTAPKRRATAPKTCRQPERQKVDARKERKPFACTFRCGRAFAKRGDWQRHEGQIHACQTMWVCPFEYCLSMPDDKKRHKRLDHFRTHVKRKHPTLDPTSDEIDECRVSVDSPFDRRCIFKYCGVTFTDWSQRCDHLASFFRRPWKFTDWRVDDEDSEMDTDDDDNRSDAASSDSDDESDDEDDPHDPGSTGGFMDFEGHEDAFDPFGNGPGFDDPGPGGHDYSQPDSFFQSLSFTSLVLSHGEDRRYKKTTNWMQQHYAHLPKFNHSLASRANRPLLIKIRRTKPLEICKPSRLLRHCSCGRDTITSEHGLKRSSEKSRQDQRAVAMRQAPNGYLDPIPLLVRPSSPPVFSHEIQQLVKYKQMVDPEPAGLPSPGVNLILSLKASCNVITRVQKLVEAATCLRKAGFSDPVFGKLLSEIWQQKDLTQAAQAPLRKSHHSESMWLSEITGTRSSTGKFFVSNLALLGGLAFGSGGDLRRLLVEVPSRANFDRRSLFSRYVRQRLCSHLFRQNTHN